MAVAKKATARNTSTKKASAKKTTTKKTTSTSGTTEMSVSGNKKIDTLRKEFNKKFPYLKLYLCFSYARKNVASGGSIAQIPGDRTLASVRREDTSGTISISPNKKVKSLEQEFDKVFGLYCQVGMTKQNGQGYYTGGSLDEKTLAGLNTWCEENGYKKGVWK